MSKFNQDLSAWGSKLNENMQSFTNMFSGVSTFSPENYTKTIVGWANAMYNRDNPLMGVSLLSGGVQYDMLPVVNGDGPFSTAVQAKEYLTNKLGWSIQDNGPKAIQITFDTTRSEGLDVILPLFGEVNCIIDWGDGDETLVNSPGEIAHTYATEGTYMVSIGGVVTQWGTEAEWAGDTFSSERLASQQKMASIGKTSLPLEVTYGMFRGTINMNFPFTSALPLSLRIVDSFARDSVNFPSPPTNRFNFSQVESARNALRNSLIASPAIVSTLLLASNNIRDLSGYLQDSYTLGSPLAINLSNMNISAVEHLTNFATGFDGWASHFYTNTLIGWANSAFSLGGNPTGVTFDAPSAVAFEDEVGIGNFNSVIDAKNYLEQTLGWTINDGGSRMSEPLIIEFDTTLSAGTYVELPFANVINYRADWGDGTINSGFSHTYAEEGEYTAKFFGGITQWGNTAWGFGGWGVTTLPTNRLNSQLKISRVVQWPTDSGLTFLQNSLRNTGSYLVIPDEIPQSLTIINYLFNSSSYNGSSITNWDVSNITSLWSAFRNSQVNQDLGSWGTTLPIAIFSDMLTNSAISPENYARTLIGWANAIFVRGGIVTGRNLGATNVSYSTQTFGDIIGEFNNAVDARNYLVNTLGWTITDAGAAV